VVLYETARGVERVAVCSAQAEALGIRVDMPVAEAEATTSRSHALHGNVSPRCLALGDRRPCAAGSHAEHGNQIVLYSYDPPADLEALQKLAERCERFSPTVGVEPGERPEGLLLDISRVAELLGGEAELAAQLAGDFARRGLAVRLGVADTIGAAWAAAHYGAKAACGFADNDCKLQIENCKLQIDDVPPPRERGPRNPAPKFSIFNFQFSICNIPPSIHPTALRPLPVEALRLSGETVNVLHQLGIDRLAQLEALPREDLASRFAPELLRRLDQAAGRLPEAIPGHRAGPEFQVEWSPEHPTTRGETIRAALEQLIRDLCGQLVRHGRGAVQLECRLVCPPQEPVRIGVGLFEPSSAWKHLFGLVELKIEQLRLPGPVVAAFVAAAATAPLVYKQQELVSDEGPLSCAAGEVPSPRPSPGGRGNLGRRPSPGGRGSLWRRRRLAGLVDRLSSRLGRRAVVGVRLLADAQPELAWCYDPMVGRSWRQAARANRRSARSRKQGRRPSPAVLPPRPLRLRRRPVALAVTSIGPDRFGQEGCPVRFHFQGREHRVGRCWGPERIETGWWRGRAVGRDYYRVETTTGRHYWLFRRLRDGKWFFQGAFE